MKKPVEEIVEASGVDLSNGGGFQNLSALRSIFETTRLLCLMV